MSQNDAGQEVLPPEVWRQFGPVRPLRLENKVVDPGRAPLDSNLDSGALWRNTVIVRSKHSVVRCGLDCQL